MLPRLISAHNKHQDKMRKVIALVIALAMTAMVAFSCTSLAHAVTDDPNYYVASGISLDPNTQVSEQTVQTGFKFYIRVNAQGQKDPSNYKVTVTMPGDSVQMPNIPGFSDQWGGPHSVSTPVKDAQGNWTFTITWPTYDPTSGVAIPVSIDWKADVPLNYRLPISVSYSSDQQAQTAGKYALAVTYTYPTPQLRLNGPGIQQGATTYATTQAGVKYIDPDDLAPVIFDFSITNDSNLRRVSKYDICDILPTYMGADGQQHTAQLSSRSQADGWKLSEDGTTACFRADESNDKYNEIAGLHSLGRSLPQYSIGLTFPYLPLDGSTNGYPSTKIVNKAYIDAYANNPADTVVQRTNIASSPQTVVVAGFVQADGPTKRAPGDFAQAFAHKNTPLQWMVIWRNTSNIPATNIVLSDRSTTDGKGKTYTNDSRFKITGLNQLDVRPRGQWWWPNLTTLADAGQTLVIATTEDGQEDTYPVTWAANKRVSNALTFDTSKTYVSVRIVFPKTYALNYGEQIEAALQTKWKDPSAINYDSVTKTNNTFVNNADLSTDYSSAHNTSTLLGWASAETHLLPPPPEKLVLNAWPYNGNLTKDGSDPLLIYEVRAFLDPEKDYKDLRVLAPIPTGFTMTGTHNQNANGLPGTWTSTFVSSWEKVENYKGSGQDFLIFHINQDAAKEAFSLYPSGSMWIEVNGKVDFSKSFSGNGANKVAAFFTADNAPAQEGANTIEDTMHFGPNKNIVFSMGGYTTMNAEGDSFIKSLYGNYPAARSSQGLGETSMTIDPGRTVYWTLSYNNASAVIHKDLQMFDTAPHVGDVMPVSGQARGTQFPVRLTGRVTAVLYNFLTGKTSDYDLSKLHIRYTTDPREAGITWDAANADSSITWVDTTMDDETIPWNSITGFRVSFGDVPAFSRVRLILPTQIPENIGVDDPTLLAKANPTIQAVNAAAFSVDGRSPVQSIPSSLKTLFGSFSFKKVDQFGKSVAASEVKLVESLKGWDGDASTYSSTPSSSVTKTETYTNVDHYDWKNMPAGEYVLKETKAQPGYKNTTWEAHISVGYNEDALTMVASPKVTITCVNTAPEGSHGSGGCSVDGTTVTLVNQKSAVTATMPATGDWQMLVVAAVYTLLLASLVFGIIIVWRRNPVMNA